MLKSGAVNAVVVQNAPTCPGFLADITPGSTLLIDAYRSQVGGHNQLLYPATSSVAGAPVLKAFNWHEDVFYQRLRVAEDEPAALLRKFCPKCFGKICLELPGEAPNPNEWFLVLEDLVDGFERPSILDLKMGMKQRSVHYTKKKLVSMAKKAMQSTSCFLGFRVCGLEWYDCETDEPIRKDKYFGQALTGEGVYEVMRGFFQRKQKAIQAAVLDQLQIVIKELHDVISQQRDQRFYSASLIVIFDAGKETEAEIRDSVRVRLIDFANSIRIPETSLLKANCDNELLFGLEQLQVYIKAFQTGANYLWVQRHLHKPLGPDVLDRELVGCIAMTTSPDMRSQCSAPARSGESTSFGSGQYAPNLTEEEVDELVAFKLPETEMTDEPPSTRLEGTGLDCLPEEET